MQKQYIVEVVVFSKEYMFQNNNNNKKNILPTLFDWLKINHQFINIR